MADSWRFRPDGCFLILSSSLLPSLFVADESEGQVLMRGRESDTSITSTLVCSLCRRRAAPLQL